MVKTRLVFFKLSMLFEYCAYIFYDNAIQISRNKKMITEKDACALIMFHVKNESLNINIYHGLFVFESPATEKLPVLAKSQN